MRFGNLIFGVALLLVATTLALTITFRNEPAIPRESAARNPIVASPNANSPSSAPPRSVASNPSTNRSVARPPAPRAEDMVLSLDDGPSAPPLSPAERQALSARTAGVKSAALAKLDKMTKSFDLTENQRRKIFPLLVKDTPGYHPAMLVTQPVGGTLIPVDLATTDQPAGQTPEEAIHDVLDPAQQDAFVEDKVDELRWWDEIVSQLEDDFDSTAEAGPAPTEEIPPTPAGTAPAPEPEPDPQQSDNIFDLLDH